ncbi:MAG: tRNA-intron lyase [Candidatus Lokiarchaeota archaeon]|nr:tRNA-intron lyase [Candidatus Harpocratesius repetitus]
MSPLSYPELDENIDPLVEKTLQEGQLPDEPIEAKLIGKKILIFNHIHGYLLYGFGRYFGIPVGIRKPKTEPFQRPLELSALESYYLLKKNIILIHSFQNNTIKTWNSSEFYNFCIKNYPFFEERYIIYEDLREKKYIPRPGQKFGADFIVYRKGPGIDHSSFCIQVLSPYAKISSIDVVRSARLATSVKKRFILANPTTKTYYSFKWFKP